MSWSFCIWDSDAPAENYSRPNCLLQAGQIPPKCLAGGYSQKCLIWPYSIVTSNKSINPPWESFPKNYSKQASHHHHLTRAGLLLVGQSSIRPSVESSSQRRLFYQLYSSESHHHHHSFHDFHPNTIVAISVNSVIIIATSIIIGRIIKIIVCLNSLFNFRE